MLDRRAFLAGVAGVVVGPFVAKAQPGGKVARVGVLYTGSSTETAATQREPFERGLRELGWISGSNIVIEYRYGEGSVERLTTAAQAMARQGLDLFVARGNAAIRCAEAASATIPIVMSSADDPVTAGFVATLGRPGGRITGIANRVTELDSKRLEILKEAIPTLKRIAVLANPSMCVGRYERIRNNSLRDARSLGLDAQVFELTRLDDLEAVFVAMGKARTDGMLTIADTIVLEPNRGLVVATALKHRLPAMYPWHFYTEVGGLMSYATSIPAFHHRSATFVDKILKGAKPADLPVEQPTKFELVINLKTAKVLGLTIPRSVLLRADQVIQ